MVQGLEQPDLALACLFPITLVERSGSMHPLAFDHVECVSAYDERLPTAVAVCMHNAEVGADRDA